jgi:Abnormal spindle-like microcephaly-assoc'd, ASPM-SPD-2-Hydin
MSGTRLEWGFTVQITKKSLAASLLSLCLVALASCGSVSETPATNKTQLLLNSSVSTLSFGSVAVSSSSVQNVTLTNAGRAKVTISQVLVAGAGFNSTGGSSGLILEPGQSSTLTSTFAPSASGVATGKITVSSNASNSPVSILLSGTGAALSAHSVILSWTGDSGIAAYNAYSSPASGGPFVRLTSTPLSSPNYTDTTVQSGRTYYYVVTAVNSSNEESTYSREVTAIVP